MTPENGNLNRENINRVVQRQKGGLTSGGINHPIPEHKPEIGHDKKPVHHHAVRNTIAVIASAATIATAGVAIDQGNKNGWFKGLFAKVSSSEDSGSSSQSNSEFISSLESSMESRSESKSNSSVSSSNPEVTKAPTPTPTPEVTKAPTPTPEDLVMKEKLALAPDVEGTVKVVKELNGLKRVVYEAVKGNRFGLEAGSYAGEYKKEVTFEGQETGGIALVPKIAEKILLEQIAKQTDEQGKWLIPMILDISDMKTLKEVKITKADGYVYGTTDCMWGIEVNEPVSVAFCIPGGGEITSGTLALDQSVTAIYPLFYRNNNNNKMILGKEMNYITTRSPFDGQPVCWTKKTFSFGESMGNTSKECRIDIGTNVEIINPTFEKILTMEKDGKKVPIFIVSN